MRNFSLSLRKIIIPLVILSSIAFSFASKSNIDAIWHYTPPDSTLKKDTNIPLPFPFNDHPDFETGKPQHQSQLYLKDPANLKTETEYDPATNQYIQRKKLGNIDYRRPKTMSDKEFIEYDFDKSLRKYWLERAKAGGSQGNKGLIPQLHVGGQVFESIFGSNTIDIKPQGSAELIFGLRHNRNDNPLWDTKQRRTTNFNFEQKIQMNVTAKIGDKIELRTNYNTEASFEFENKMKLQYQGKEDEIIKSIEVGDVSLPLTSNLITGSQSLFGIKTKLQFGKAYVTTVFSQQKSETKTIEVNRGAQQTDFMIKADEYEENKHFFLANYFRANYNEALKRLPIINSPINITKIEVWVTTRGAAVTENRNIVAITQLGEIDAAGKPLKLPDNSTFYSTFDRPEIRALEKVDRYMESRNYTSGLDYEKIENARKLLPNEYSYNGKLGFLSLNTTLNSDQVLAVAFQYKIIGDTTTYQVGEFASQGVNGSSALIVKLLKSTATNTRSLLWKLMMKNVYNLGGYQISNNDFRLNVLYIDDENGVPAAYLKEGKLKGKPLLQVFNLDNLNAISERRPDGMFDFIDLAATEGGTIHASNGRVFFPVTEPFGKTLRDSLDDVDLANKYCYDSLYTMTKYGAQQFPEKNRFILEGSYKASGGADIPLNAMNIPQGSVKVTCGGRPLFENVDFTVDYTFGRVKIINESELNSGQTIQISFENRSMFNIQQKTLFGTHVDYMFHKDFMIGATYLHLKERPLTQKINMGDEPISNSIWGLNASYRTDSRLITKILDKLPFYSTKTVSKINIDGEFAHLVPGHSRAIGKTGTSYIDDFEGSKQPLDLKSEYTWNLASIPKFQPDLFPEANAIDVSSNFNRAKIAWYRIDNILLRNNSLTPAHIKKDANMQSNHFMREVLETEVFPNKELPNGTPNFLPTMDIAFYPAERGPYNFNVARLKPDGLLNNPNLSWGGIMRKLENTDFEAMNVEYLEFWMMDPFIDPDGSGPLQSMQQGGNLYINLGDISEDILKDGRKSYEHCLPTGSQFKDVDSTIWGIVPKTPSLSRAFADPDLQDVGLDGLNDVDERAFFDSVYLQKIANHPNLGSSSNAYQKATEDPSGDNYKYWRSSQWDNEKADILTRYKFFNNTEGNSKRNQPDGYPTTAYTQPDVEDINDDNTLSTSERYFQYKIALQPNNMIVGQNFITDIYEALVPLRNGSSARVKWYQFKVPIHNPERIVGAIQDFKSIRFIRMFMKDFEENAVLRFATLELVRGEWRKCNVSLETPGEYILPIQDEATFDISTVNIEENGQRVPIPYVLPPGIEREINQGTTNLQKLNEQSLVLKVCDLKDGDSRAVYKTSDLDVRQYGKIKMYVHAESSNNNEPLKDGDVSVFLRLGNDFTGNYYEYEIPLALTPWGVNRTDAEAIWPENNRFDIDLQKLIYVKQERNIKMREEGSTQTLSLPYVTYDGNNKITIVGTPNLSNIRTMMIGIRNPKQTSLNGSDDGLSKCAEIWVNEFRLTDFNEKGGWAATGRINTTLADLGNLSVGGFYSTAGFGSIDKKINERQKENISRLDAATNIELSKFLPPKTGLKIPMHFDILEEQRTPEYDPLNPDIKLRDELNTFANKEDKKKYKNKVVDYTLQKSINFVNVKKEKTGKGQSKSHFYDISNLDFTYAYTEIYHRNIDIEYNMKKNYTGVVGYTFNNNPKNVTPLGKIKFLNKNKWLKLISDFNFYYAPRMISIRNELNKQFEENLFRNKSNADVPMFPYYIKKFNWNRTYDVKFDLTKALKVDYNALASARIREPYAKIDKNSPYADEMRDTVWNSIKELGEINNFNQKINISYQVPINKIPIFDWVNLQTNYTGDFTWIRALPAAEELGNNITSSNNKKITFNGNMVNLYNKVNFLKKLNQQKAPPKKAQNFEAEDDTVKSSFKDIGKVIRDNTLKVLMSLKNVSYSYSQTNGFTLPGYTPIPVYMGQDWKINAPGTEAIFGNPFMTKHDDFMFYKARNSNWLSTDTSINTAFATQFMENHSFRANLEPINDLKIEITAIRNYSSTRSFFFGFNTETNQHFTDVPMERGNFTISFLSWKTAFIPYDKKTYQNETFNQFINNRMAIAQRLAAQNPNSNGITDTTGFPDGYGPTSQNVLIPAFLAAYTKTNVNDASLNPFISMPKPNWRITYDGLSKIEFFKQYLKKISITHGYKSAYSINNYANFIDYAERDGAPYVRYSRNNDFIPQFDIPVISITEQFNPLIGFDLSWVNSLMTKIELKRSRDLNFSFANYQLTEVRSNDVVLGLGYRFKNVGFKIKQGKRINSDINLRSDLTIRRNITILRRLLEDIIQPSTGQRTISLNTSADYQISPKLTAKIFFDKTLTKPFVSNQYPSGTTNGGFSIRFSL